MEKRIGYCLMVVLLLLFGLASMGASSGSQDEIVVIKLRLNEVTIGPGQVGIIRWGWGTCTKGLTTDFVSATEQNWILKYNGKEIQTIHAEDAASYWQDPEIDVIGPVELGCVWPAKNVWKQIWEFNKLKLNKPGDYELVLYIALTEPLIDGADSDQNGQIDVYEGVIFNKSIIIHVIK